MKCQACGYERMKDEYKDVEVKVTHGKNKGKVKKTHRVLVNSYDDFIELFVIDKLGFTRRVQDAYDPVEEVGVYACPKCGTLRMGGWRFQSSFE